jgi:hypothetical protein
MPEDFAQRRKPARYKIDLPLGYSCPGEDPFIPTTTRDISSQGIGLATPSLLKVGAPVEAFIIMPDNMERICLKGEVAWAREYQGSFRAGLRLVGGKIKPIPLVLRAVNSRL